MKGRGENWSKNKRGKRKRKREKEQKRKRKKEKKKETIHKKHYGPKMEKNTKQGEPTNQKIWE